MYPLPIRLVPVQIEERLEKIGRHNKFTAGLSLEFLEGMLFMLRVINYKDYEAVQ